MAPGLDRKSKCATLAGNVVDMDDMGMMHLPKRSGEYLFENIMRRYDHILPE